MTRAGEQLYRESEDREGSLLWGLITHPEFQHGARDMGRVLAVLFVVALLFGLG